MTAPTPLLDDANRDYGERVIAVEPGGVEAIAGDERHGRPIGLLWTWVSPNMEFATVAVGILSILAFGLDFWQAVWAIVLGTALGSISQGVLSTWGPREGLCQMVLSRTAFGYFGNLLPAGLNALTAGIGWFAVNSISGALALHALLKLPNELALVIVVAVQLVVAFFGHNLVHAFERYAFPVLTVLFLIAAIWVLTKAHPGMPAFTKDEPPTVGGFLITVGASFGYAAGWNPYASDYTRYLPARTRRAPIAIFAGLGVFLSCVLLEVAGAAVVTAGQSAVDPSSFTNLTPTAIGKLTLLAIVIGSIAANVLNVYSGAMSFMAIGWKVPSHQARAIVAAVFAVIGFVVASFGISNAGTNYENFLLIIAYWIAPWLGVVFVDRVLRFRRPITSAMLSSRYHNWAGPIAMAVGAAVSIWLFSNQTKYLGPVPKAHPKVGDLTAEVGFVIAAVLYLVLFLLTRPAQGELEASDPAAEDGVRA